MRTALAVFVVLVPLAAAAQVVPLGPAATRPTNSPDLIASDWARAEEVARFRDSPADLVAALAPAEDRRLSEAGYKAKIYQARLTTHPGLGFDADWDPDAAVATHRLALNDNHTRDLPVPFPIGGAELTPAARVVLDALGEALADPSLLRARYLIAAHTDTAGDAGRNQWLSERRAAAAVEYLVRRHAIAPSRLVAGGFGEADPLTDVAGDSARHRRIEVTLIEADDGPGPALVTDRAERGLTGARRGPAEGIVAAGRAGSDRAAASARRHLLLAERRTRIARARNPYADAGGGAEVPEAVVDASGRIVGARPIRRYGRGRIRPCDPALHFACAPSRRD